MKNITLKIIVFAVVLITAFSGCEDVFVDLSEIVHDNTPVADFYSSNISEFLSVTFYDKSTNNPTSWQWNFGDGKTSAQQNPEHTYEPGGSYTVTLIVSNDYGSDTISKSDFIILADSPVAKFTANITSGPAPLSVNFTDQSTKNPTSWHWNFGDGLTSVQQNPEHTYDAEGLYTVTLTAYNGPVSDRVSKTDYIVVTGPPVAEFTANLTSGSAPLTVNFTDQSTNNPITWQWNFGDGGTSTQQNPVHTYNAFGDYTVSLSVSNSYGADTESKTDYISVSGSIGSFTDLRDGQTYQTVEIGSQNWFAENLKYETADSWWYDNSSDNGDVYGRLYTWDAALTACPEGWHLPGDDEWKQMEMTLGMNQNEADKTDFRGTDEGEKMKSTNGWFNNGNGTNSSGFDALPGGRRTNSGLFEGLDYHGYWWSSSEGSPSPYAWHRRLYYNKAQVSRVDVGKTYGFSVRCLKDSFGR